MSQVAKSASAFVRAFLAILVLELEDMVVRLVRPPKLAGVHGYRWTVRLGIRVPRILRKRAELAAVLPPILQVVTLEQFLDGRTLQADPWAQGCRLDVRY